MPSLFIFQRLDMIIDGYGYYPCGTGDIASDEKHHTEFSKGMGK